MTRIKQIYADQIKSALLRNIRVIRVPLSS